MEACGSAHYWAETLSEMSHEVKLIVSQYVRLFVKRQKNDAAKAEAIIVAAQRPEMRLSKLKRKSSAQKRFCFARVSV